MTSGSPAARLPRRFRHSRRWWLGLATPPPSGPLAGLRAWQGQSGSERGRRAVSESFLLGFEGFRGVSVTAGAGVWAWRHRLRQARWLIFGPGEASLGGSLATLGELSPTPVFWASKVTFGSPAARLPRRFRHSRRWCLGLATPPPSGPLAGLRAWRGQSGRERGHSGRAVSYSPFLWHSGRDGVSDGATSLCMKARTKVDASWE